MIKYHKDLETHYIDILSNDAKEHYDELPAMKIKLAKDVSEHNVYSNIYQKGSAKHIIITNIDSYFNSYLYGFFAPADTLIALNNFNYLLEVFIIMICGTLLASISNWYEKFLRIKNHYIISTIFISATIFISSEYLAFINSSWSESFDLIGILVLLNNIMLYLLIFMMIYKKVSIKGKFDKYLNSFAAIGRLTLSWYLLQSCIMGLLLFNYGLGLYGKVGVADCFLFTTLYYCFCYKVSPWWLEKFQNGPIEKLWRWLTIPKVYN